MSGGVMRLANRKAGAGLSVIGGSAILEWAELFGDGGPIYQLIFGIVAFAAGTALFLSNWRLTSPRE